MFVLLEYFLDSVSEDGLFCSSRLPKDAMFCRVLSETKKIKRRGLVVKGWQAVLRDSHADKWSNSLS